MTGSWTNDSSIFDAMDTVGEAVHRLSEKGIRTYGTRERELVLEYPNGLRVRLVAEKAAKDLSWADELRDIRWTVHRIIERLGRLGERMVESGGDRLDLVLQSMAISTGSFRLVLVGLAKALSRLADLSGSRQPPDNLTPTTGGSS